MRKTKLTPIKDILPGIVNPASEARARVEAILDGQAKRDPVTRNIARLKRDELFEDPFK